MNKKTKLVVIGSMFAFMIAIGMPAIAGSAEAATNITIKNNGADSTNKIKVSKKKGKKGKKVRQRNRNRVRNKVRVMQNTGGNTANKNTGKGEVEIDTGKTTSTVTNKTTTKGNEANVESCGCENDGELNITIKGNGADSTNKVKVSYWSNGGGGVSQSNYSNVSNSVSVKQNTGWNEANKNTGNGGVSITTGNATSTVTNTTTTGGNTINP